MSYHSERQFHLGRIIRAAMEAKEGFRRCDDLEDEHKVVIALTTNLAAEIADLTKTITGETVWGHDVLHEGILDNVGVAFNDAIDKRDDRRSPESRAAYAADAIRSMA